MLAVPSSSCQSDSFVFTRSEILLALEHSHIRDITRGFSSLSGAVRFPAIAGGRCCKADGQRKTRLGSSSDCAHGVYRSSYGIEANPGWRCTMRSPCTRPNSASLVFIRGRQTVPPPGTAASNSRPSPVGDATTHRGLGDTLQTPSVQLPTGCLLRFITTRVRRGERW